MDPNAGSRQEEDKAKVLMFTAKSDDKSEKYPFYHQSIQNVRNFMQAN